MWSGYLITLCKLIKIKSYSTAGFLSYKCFIALLEEIIGKKALINQLSMQPGDVNTTYADISKAQQLLGYEPKTSFKEGLTKFVEWYKTHRL